MTAYLYSPITPVADRYEVSHRAGWALYLAQELGAKLITTKDMKTFGDRVVKGDTVFVYHGMEFKGGLNFPGGPQPVVYERLELLRVLANRLGPNLISLDIPMPDYGKLLQRLPNFDWQKLSKALRPCQQTIFHPEGRDHLIMGDSHSLSRYVPGSRIHRSDGATLFGAVGTFNKLKSRTEEAMRGRKKPFKTITFYYGNIDIRHHLARPGVVTVKDLMTRYADAVAEVRKAYPKTEIIVVEPLPIENESRKLPKTGWFKGTPFFGSWEKRTELRLQMEDHIVGIGIVGAHPNHFWNDISELSFDVMEKPQSVHIRPAEYTHIQKGGSWTCV